MTRHDPDHTDIDLVRRHLHHAARHVGDGPDLLDAAHAYAGRASRRTSTALAAASSAAVVASAIVTATLIGDAYTNHQTVRPGTSITPTAVATAAAKPTPKPLPACSTDFPRNAPMPTAGSALQAVLDTGYVDSTDTLAIAQDQQITGIDLTTAQTLLEETHGGTLIARYVVTHLTNGTWQLARIYPASPARHCPKSTP